MKKKLFLLVLLSSIVVSAAGCGRGTNNADTGTEKETGFEILENRPVATTEVGEIVEETEIDSTLGPNDPYPIGHTLYDNSITFSDDVAVIMHDQIQSYRPSSRKVTITNQATLGDCKYAYVYYSESPSLFLFQRITKIATDSKGYTTITLSGTPLQSEMDKKDFLNLIVDVNEYGDNAGSDRDAFDSPNEE